jgi:hypothetical protein
MEQAQMAGGAPGQAGARDWAAHPVDLRFTVKLPFGRYYLAVVAGPERRTPSRASAERKRRRLATLGNFLFFLATAIAVNVVALAGLLIYSAVLRF